MWQLLDGSINLIVGIGLIAIGTSQISDYIWENVHRNERKLGRKVRLYKLINNKGETEYKTAKELEEIWSKNTVLTSPTDVVKEEPDNAPVGAITNAIPSKVEARPCCGGKKECQSCGFSKCTNSEMNKGKEIGDVFWTCTPTDLEKSHSNECNSYYGQPSCHLINKTNMKSKKVASAPVEDDAEYFNNNTPNYDQQRDMGKHL